MTPKGLENMQNYLVPAAGTTHGYRYTGELVLGEPVEIDFRSYDLNGRTFAPSGVLIDNTLGTADMVVTIVEFQFRLICKKGNTLMLPYPAPLNQTARIEGEGPITVIFVDYPVQPYSTAGGSGSGPTPGGGRSTMFHGCNLQGIASAPPVSTDTPIVFSVATLDPDGWLQSGQVIVPAGVEVIHLTMVSQVIPSGGGGRPSSLWTAGGTNYYSGTNTDATTMELIDFGIINVVAGQDITPTVNIGVATTGAGGILFVEVLQGSILAT